ncbi:MAG TPA: methionine adenosyltransferase [Burkholderiales bacterium]
MGTRSRRIVVLALAPRAPGAAEMCEHKGIGHPDTITDGACEAVAQALVRAYEERFGGVLHFNVDKGLLVGGASEPRFGGGALAARAKLIVCGRATNPGRALDLPGLVVESARRWLDDNLRASSAPFELSSEVREGSTSLKRVLGAGPALANDTSFGVGYAPLSGLERKVLALAGALRSAALRERFPALGDDFKIMGLRLDARLTFTVAIAFVDRHVESVAHYFELKDQVRNALAARLDAGDTVLVNQLDDPAARDESALYLTVSGLSAEMGDDGQVGRGNRVNGLITPGRPMSLEAAAGKNPCSHVGKIYNVLAHRIARAICAEVPEVPEANVQLLSTIGSPIDEPQAAIVEIGAAAGVAVRERVAALVDREIASVPALVAELARGGIAVY